jgi:hypothetical protein
LEVGNVVCAGEDDVGAVVAAYVVVCRSSAAVKLERARGDDGGDTGRV